MSRSAVQPSRWTLAAAWYGLAVIIVASIFASVDRQILILVTEPLKHDLGLSDTQIGTLNGIALSLVAALATLPMGYLADRVDRRVLLWSCVLFWSAATGALSLAQTFPQLFLGSMGIALGEAVLGPITYTLIPDLFPKEKWIVANYVFFLAAIIGASAGLSLSGAMIGAIEEHRASLPQALAHLATWRVALIAVAIPGPLIALLIALMRLRRSVKDHKQNETGLLAYVRDHTRTVIGVFVGFGLSAAAYGTIVTWMAVALVRVFAETPAQTGIRLGLVYAIASVSGVFLSGALVRMFSPRLGKKAPIRVAEIGIIFAALLTALYVVAHDARMIYAITGVQVASIMCALSLSPTMLQYIAPNHIRGRVIAIGGLFYVVLQSISPVIVGVVSDHMASASNKLILAVVVVSLPAFIAGASVLWLAEKTLPATMEAAVADEEVAPAVPAVA